ncbi:MAG: BatD family protein [Candidatus Muiribacteriota bacterium]
MNLIINIKKFLILFLILFLYSTVIADVTLSVSSSNIQMNSSFNFRISIEGNYKNIGEPEIERSDFFQIINVSSGRSVNIVNFQTTIRHDFTYTAMALKKGEFELGPAFVEVDGRKIESNKVILRILDADESAELHEQNIIAWQETDKEHYYLGEQIIFKIIFAYRNVRLANIRLEEPEMLKNLFSHQAQQKEGRRIINGQQYNVIELIYPIIPHKTGNYEISDTRLFFDVIKQQQKRRNDFFDDDFFDSFFSVSPFADVDKKMIQPEKILFKIEPLPDTPVNFSNGVGIFELSSQISSNNVSQGEAIALNIKVSGVGNAASLERPVIKHNSDYSVTFSSERKEEKTEDGLIFGEKYFEYIIIPEKTGEVLIEPFKFIYYNTSKKDFEELSTPVYKVNVSQNLHFSNQNGKIEDFSGAGGQNFQNLKHSDTDIRYIIKRRKLSINSHKKIIGFLTFINLIFVASNLIYFLSGLISSKFGKSSKSKILNIRKKLSELLNTNAFFSNFSHVYWKGFEFLFSDKTVDINSEVVIDRIKQLFVNDTEIENLIKLNEKITMIAFGAVKINAENQKEYFDEANRLLNYFYDKWRKKI